MPRFALLRSTANRDVFDRDRSICPSNRGLQPQDVSLKVPKMVLEPLTHGEEVISFHGGIRRRGRRQRWVIGNVQAKFGLRGMAVTAAASTDASERI